MKRTRVHDPAFCPTVLTIRHAAACLRLVLLLSAALLVSFGCAPKAGSVAPRTALSLKPSVPVDGSARAVQGTPEYRQAVRCFAQRNYGRALSLIDRLLAEPQFAQDPSGSGFLRSQQAICRLALNPRALNPRALKPQAQNSHSPNSHGPDQIRPVSPPAVAVAPVAATASPADCGPRALLLLCPQYGVHTTLDALRRQAGTTAAGTSLAGLAKAAQGMGLKARGMQMDRQALEQLPGPAVAWVDGNHYVALLSVEGQRATIHDPNQQTEEVLPVTRLLQRSGGVLLTLSR